jgi:hypothetical protein
MSRDVAFLTTRCRSFQQSFHLDAGELQCSCECQRCASAGDHESCGSNFRPAKVRFRTTTFHRRQSSSRSLDFLIQREHRIGEIFDGFAQEDGGALFRNPRPKVVASTFFYVSVLLCIN